MRSSRAYPSRGFARRSQSCLPYLRAEAGRTRSPAEAAIRPSAEACIRPPAEAACIRPPTEAACIRPLQRRPAFDHPLRRPAFDHPLRQPAFDHSLRRVGRRMPTTASRFLSATAVIWQPGSQHRRARRLRRARPRTRVVSRRGTWHCHELFEVSSKTFSHGRPRPGLLCATLLRQLCDVPAGWGCEL